MSLVPSFLSFLTEEDRDLFILLTSVSGVGPKVGIKMLSQLSVSELVKAIIQENLVALTSVSGVGKKMAERLVVELKDKLPKLYNTETLSSETEIVDVKPIVNAEDDLFQAMKTLGYSQDEIKRSYMKAALELKADMSLEASLKILLKYL